MLKQSKKQKQINFTAADKRMRERERLGIGFSRLNASYDNAATTALNREHWANADNLGSFDSTNRRVREVLRARSRFECIENSPYLKGMVLTLSNSTIGTTPRLMIDTGSPELNQLIEKEFSRWMKATLFAEKLRLMKTSKTVDGESFALFVQNERLPGEVQLDIQVIEADLVSSPDFIDNFDNTDGILYEGNQPVTYEILTSHPNAQTVSTSNEEVSIPEPAENVMHFYRVDRPGQRRGIPELASALELAALARRFTLSVVTAAEAVASFGTGVITTNTGDPASQIADPYDEFNLNHGMFLTLPDGADLKQLKAEQPSATYSEFMRQLIAQVARCLSMPLNIALGDSSGFNFASGRLDHQLYLKSIQVERSKIENEILSRVFSRWIEEAALAGLIPGASADLARSWRLNWIWDSFEHVDPLKEANASNVSLAGGYTDEFTEAAKYGRDYTDVVMRRVAARELRAALGEPDPVYAVDQQPAPVDEETELDETETQTGVDDEIQS